MHQGVQYKKTRIAPTPSGFLHLGNAYSFALTASLAHRTGAKILLRIDDLDSARVRKEYTEDIFETLRFLEIPWHEGPERNEDVERHWSQQQRRGIYRNLLQELRSRDLVYACSCSRAQLAQHVAYPGTCRHRGIPLDEAEVCWRLKTERDLPLVVNTMDQGEVLAKLPTEMRDFIVRKKDGEAAYQLASLADDLYFNVDLVVRGQDLWPSTLAQLYLANLLEKKEFAETTFHHHPLFVGERGGKLSKSAGDTSIQALRKQGKTAEAIYALIGERVGINSVKNWSDLYKA